MAKKLMKDDIINSVVKETGLSKKDAGAAVEAFTKTVQDALKKGNSIGLIGFGTFEVRTRAAREGRNPRTGEPLKIAKKKVPAFKAGKKLKDAVS
ncbi:MAG: HU family DNA-binding protein [Candidatus Poribacteria bacterium]|nr:HU family DNA-binding protein [Candidatus Poribacteria bacterium]